MDTLEWSKQFTVLSFSRLTLSSRGFSNEQIGLLTEADLAHIAEVLQTLYPDFEESVHFITALRRAEKEQYIAKLLTEELKKQLPQLYSQQSEKDPLVVCKFFHPLSPMTWYATEGSLVDADGYYDTDKESATRSPETA